MLFNKNELLKEIADLEKKNEELEAAIHRIDDKELFETVKIYTHLYRKFMYRKIPFSFLETVFYYQKDLLLKYATGCFIERILDVSYERSVNEGKLELIMHIPMYCSNILNTDKGVILTLMDPYRTINTKPLKRISEASALNCKGRMLIAKLVIPENHRAINSFELKEYKLLKMSLTNIFGKEPPINYNDLFTRFKGVRTEKDAIKAIDFIESYYNMHNEYMVCRCNENNLRIVTENKRIGIWYEKEQLWYGEEPCNSLVFYKAMTEIPRERDTIFQNNSAFLFDDENMCVI